MEHSHPQAHGPTTARRTFDRVALSATAHCLTGCAIGEVLGLVLATWWGWGDAASIALAIVLAFAFGYSLTLAPLLRGGVALGAAVGIALAADTLSIAVAFAAAYPVNRWLIARGKGHALAHAHHG